MFTDGLITKEERDNAFTQVDQMQNTLAANEASKNNQASLPNVEPSNYPIINQGSVGTGSGGSNAQLAQALNLFNKGGIVSAKKNF